MRRRELISGAGAALLAGPAMASSLPVPASGEIGFAVLHNGSKIGEHHLKFTQNGDALRVDIEAALLVYFADIPIFHYKFAATEHWSGSAFCGVDSHVNHNGTLLEVHASPIAGGFAINSTKAGNYFYTGSPAMMPLSYWNKSMLQGMILNLETGRHYPAIVSSPGWYELPTLPSGQILAQRFDVTGKLHLSVWYDQNAQWAGLEFHVEGDDVFQKITSV